MIQWSHSIIHLGLALRYLPNNQLLVIIGSQLNNAGVPSCLQHSGFVRHTASFLHTREHAQAGCQFVDQSYLAASTRTRRTQFNHDWLKNRRCFQATSTQGSSCNNKICLYQIQKIQHDCIRISCYYKFLPFEWLVDSRVLSNILHFICQISLSGCGYVVFSMLSTLVDLKW